MIKELAISVQTSPWYDGVNHEEMFEYIKSLGFEAVDYGINVKYPGALIKKLVKSEYFAQDIDTILEDFRPVKEAMEKTGIYAGQAHSSFPLYFDGEDEFNEQLMMVVEKSCAICQYIGCPSIVVHPWSCHDKAREREVNIMFYRQIIPFAKKYGVRVCLENMHYAKNGKRVPGACGTPDEVIDIIDTLNEEAGETVFGYCFDLGHATLSHRPIREDIRKLGHRLTELHLHDSDSVNDNHLAPMVLKTTDWDGLIAGLRDINYRGAINFETFAAIGGFPPVLRTAMLKYIADVGKYIRDKILEEEK